jgi:hypothetical protein
VSTKQLAKELQEGKFTVEEMKEALRILRIKKQLDDNKKNE